MTDHHHEASELRGQVAASIRKEAVSLVAKWTIGAVAALILAALSGWWLYLEPKLAQQFGGVPPKAVMAFNQATCPAGWKPFSPARGRTIVGIGQPEQQGKFSKDQQGRKLNTYEFEQHGGEQLVATLTGELAGDSPPYANVVPWIALEFCEKS